MLFNRVRAKTQTTGAGPVDIGPAVAGFRGFAGVVPDGARVSYVIEEGTAWEMGRGVYSQGILARNPHTSSAHNRPIELHGEAVVAIAPAADDIADAERVEELENEIAKLRRLLDAVISAVEKEAARA